MNPFMKNCLFIIKCLFRVFNTSQSKLLVIYGLNLFRVKIDILIFKNIDHIYTSSSYIIQFLLNYCSSRLVIERYYIVKRYVLSLEKSYRTNIHFSHDFGSWLTGLKRLSNPTTTPIEISKSPIQAPKGGNCQTMISPVS